MGILGIEIGLDTTKGPEGRLSDTTTKDVVETHEIFVSISQTRESSWINKCRFPFSLKR